jgi:hypothetical protein
VYSIMHHKAAANQLWAVVAAYLLASVPPHVFVAIL